MSSGIPILILIYYLNKFSVSIKRGKVMIYNTEQLEMVIQQIQKDDVIVFPTDTVYGIGARIDSDKGLKKIFEVKNRPSEKSLIILCANIQQMEEIVGPLDQQTLKLVEAFLPGGLTFILDVYKPISEEITRGKKTVGVRIPDHPVALKLIEALGPLATTSANISGEPSPMTIDLSNPVISRVEYVIDAGLTKEQIPSTILKCKGGGLSILRQGAISEEQIKEVLFKN